MKTNVLEKEIGIKRAVKQYERSIARNSDEDNAFERLAIIYRDQNLLSEEIRVCEQAVAFYEEAVFKKRLQSRLPTLNRFTRRLKAARSLLNPEKPDI